MLKRDRPWDKAKRGPPKVTKRGLDVPHVEIDGTKFYSDRFYLNRTLLDDCDSKSTSVPEMSAAATSSFHCTCGAADPPPLFNRSALLQSCGKLKAAVIGTYSFDVTTMKQEFPMLFGPTADIPCLVLHGKKGWRQTKPDVTDDHPESGPSVDDYSDCVENKDDGCISLGTQDEETMEMSKSYSNAYPEHPFQTTSTGVDSSRPRHNSEVLPESVYFSEITSTWLKPNDAPVSFAAAVDKDTGYLRQSVVDQRMYKRGVHHPKFMLLLEESGSIVVVVSTANYTPAVTTDASWVQRFPAASTIAPSTQPQSSRPTNDFGTVLANFLQCQMLATVPEQVTAHWFFKHFLGWKSLVDLERKFDYSSAQVQLVATVPGEYEVDAFREGKPRDQTVSTPKQLLYGQQRISDCLTQLSLSPVLLTDHDRLVVQPTSFGSDWKSRNMTHLVRSYLGEHQDSEVCDHALLARLDIVWPTDHFVREAIQNLPGRHTPTLVNSDFTSRMSFATEAPSNTDEFVQTEKANEGYLFLSSETFNNIDLSCLNRMVMFEPSNPPQQPVVLTPHLKSVARVFCGSDYRIRKDYGVVKCEEYFSWFLLTSACLSRGAQGEPMIDSSSGLKTNKVAYANFEMGVLFTSKLEPRGRSPKGRIYCWKPVQCACSAKSTPRLIHLPSPFSFRPSRYVEDEDEAILCETPYFHEIPPGTGCVGNMMLTPYGAALAAHFEKRSRR